MPQSLSAPPWVKPKLNLASMPTEILEKIIAMAMPERVTVTGRYSIPLGELKAGRFDRQATKWKQCYPFRWTIWWCPGLLLVSKSIRQIVRKHLAALPFLWFTWDTSQHGFLLQAMEGHALWRAPAECKEMMRDYFRELFTRDEEHGLPTRRRAAKVEETS
ncbi:uncharacterized protein AB675_11774 [Cyphellophora attinorum]|uniref:Uncharacterized protein n=1 Tax=Cyphellophora attinorum TaxID=1664694 RepID=A0A0N0NJC9_9EURO|nr:uncharacterized protein AB675_11774 [Phialophora attinorum]KPI36768.1 hypothetical protein AB675_11774 [Phialophora attinorum]